MIINEKEWKMCQAFVHFNLMKQQLQTIMPSFETLVESGYLNEDNGLITSMRNKVEALDKELYMINYCIYHDIHNNDKKDSGFEISMENGIMEISGKKENQEEKTNEQ